MIHDPLALDDLIQTLNRFVAADPQAMFHLVETRVDCNDVLATDPTCQVVGEGSSFLVGLLGVLNGVYGTYDSGPKKGWGPIAGVYSDDGGTLMGFRKTIIPGYIIPKQLPDAVRTKFAAFFEDKSRDAFTICENDIGWFLFSLGREGLEDPIFAVAKDL